CNLAKNGRRRSGSTPSRVTSASPDTHGSSTGNLDPNDGSRPDPSRPGPPSARPPPSTTQSLPSSATSPDSRDTPRSAWCKHRSPETDTQTSDQTTGGKYSQTPAPGWAW